jgi:hypothetical protein
MMKASSIRLRQVYHPAEADRRCRDFGRFKGSSGISWGSPCFRKVLLRVNHKGFADLSAMERDA